MTTQVLDTQFLRLPNGLGQGRQPAARPVVQPPNDAKSLNIVLADCSGSMKERGKWEALQEALRGMLTENQDNGAYFMRVFFEVNKAKDPNFLPPRKILEHADTGIKPDGNTAFYDAGCRAVRYLLDGFSQYPEGSRPYGSITILTDGLDNKSASGSKDLLQISIGGLLAQSCPNKDYENAKVMIVYWGFGDGTDADRQRHEAVAEYLGIPKCWTRYSVGEAASFDQAGQVLSQSISSMTQNCGTRLIGD